MKRIYLDHAATTPIDKNVVTAMRDFELKFWGNPSSQHREGQAARASIDFARASVANFLGAKPQEIIFTSGATEANNLAIQGVIKYYISAYQIKPHVISTKLEHQSVYNTLTELQKRGVIDLTLVQPTEDGLIDPHAIIREVSENTILITCIFASNEIGSLLPIREIGHLLAEVNSKQKMTIMYHVDAVQAAKFHNCNAVKLGCDLLTLSAHKIYGPKGIGALYIKSGLKIENLSYGGSQEYGYRPGTQSSSGIIGMAKAIELLGRLEQRQELARKISLQRDKLISELSKLPNTLLNGPTGEMRNADNVSFTFLNVDQDAVMTALDLAGIAASTGSACVSGSNQPSHVILSLGRNLDRQAATVRFSLGKSTTDAQIDDTIKIVKRILHSLSKI